MRFSNFIREANEEDGDIEYGITSKPISLIADHSVPDHVHHYYIYKDCKLGRTTVGGPDGHMHLIDGDETDGTGDHYHKLNKPEKLCRLFGEFDEESSGITIGDTD